MSTRRNYNIPGHAHELTFSCYKQYPLLSKDRSREWLVEALNTACEQHRYRLWGYVFMPDHVHLLVWPEERAYDIAVFRKAIKAPVACQALAFLEEVGSPLLANLTRQRGGKVERLFWQPGGGYDRNVDNPTTLKRMLDYIHQNPVRRGLVGCAEDWEWSSAKWYRDKTLGFCTIHPMADVVA